MLKWVEGLKCSEYYLQRPPTSNCFLFLSKPLLSFLPRDSLKLKRKAQVEYNNNSSSSKLDPRKSCWIPVMSCFMTYEIWTSQLWEYIWVGKPSRSVLLLRSVSKLTFSILAFCTFSLLSCGRIIIMFYSAHTEVYIWF